MFCNSGGSGAVLLDKGRFPTVLGCASSIADAQTSAIVEFVKQFKWSVISIICDDNWIFSYPLSICNYVVSQLEKKITVHIIRFDSTRKVNFTTVLDKAKQRSRSKSLYG